MELHKTGVESSCAGGCFCGPPVMTVTGDGLDSEILNDVEKMKPDPVKKAKLKKVEEMITASDKDIFFKPQSKERQVGKK